MEYSRRRRGRLIAPLAVICGASKSEHAPAGIRFEHLCRLETGKHIPGVPIFDKIDRAFEGIR